MGRFTELTDVDIAALAEEFGLGTISSWRPLEAGTINSNFEVDTDEGRFFLRVNEGKSEADVAYEARLIRALAERGVNTPLPWEAQGERDWVSYQGKLVSVFPWVSGEHRDLLDVGISDVGLVGGELARLHVAGRDLHDEMRRDGIYTFEKIVERYQGFRDSDDGELAEAIELIGDEIAWLSERQAQRDAAPHGIIHGDLFRDNVLFHDQGVSLLDFEQASWGSLTYDLAVCLNAWCFSKKFNKHFIKELVAGYRAERPLEPGQAELLYVEARAAAMRFTVTRITDVYLAKSGVEDKDFRRYLDRLKQLRDLGGDKFAKWAGLDDGAE